MPSITTWTRIEPRARGTNLRPSLEGRVFDPAWLLARQWQVGEFAGTDAGTPTTAHLTIATAPMDAFQTGTAAAAPTGPRPVECLIGPEPTGPPTVADSAASAAELVRLLRENGMSATGMATVGRGLRTAGVVPMSSAGSTMLALLDARLPDVVALERFWPEPRPPARPRPASHSTPPTPTRSSQPPAPGPNGKAISNCMSMRPQMRGLTGGSSVPSPSV